MTGEWLVGTPPPGLVWEVLVRVWTVFSFRGSGSNLDRPLNYYYYYLRTTFDSREDWHVTRGTCRSPTVARGCPRSPEAARPRSPGGSSGRFACARPKASATAQGSGPMT